MNRRKNLAAIERVELPYKGRSFEIEYFVRPGELGEVILLLHGLGGAKENFLEATKFTGLRPYTLICFDNPGTGNSCYFDDQSLSVDDLVEITHKFITALCLKSFHLVGTSMGGLVALLYMQRHGTSKVLSHVNIEGNFMPEDCMFSSKVIKHDKKTFLDSAYPASIKKMRISTNPGYRIIANNLEINTNASAYFDYSLQTVLYSHSGFLLEEFLNLPMRRQFIYGSENSGLSYLERLRGQIDSIAEIPESNHFIFYDNPFELYREILSFLSNRS